MKKFTKIASVIVAVSMIAAAATGCSKSKKDDDVEGEYSAQYNVADMIMSGAGLSADDAEIFFDVSLELDDGNYVLDSDGEKNLDNILDYMTSDEGVQIILDQFGATEEQADTMAQAQGYDTFRDYIADMFTSYDADDLAMHEEGTYEIDGDTITFTPEDDGEIGEATIDDGEITVEFEDGSSVVFSK